MVAYRSNEFSNAIIKIILKKLGIPSFLSYIYDEIKNIGYGKKNGYTRTQCS